MIKLFSFAALSLLLSHPAWGASYGIHYPKEVTQLFTQINPDNLWLKLNKLTQFPDRSATHQSGLDAQKWLELQVTTLAKNANREVSIVTIDTQGKDPWSQEAFNVPQASVVMKIGNANAPAIVLGAHFDTLGCDDEGCKQDPYGPLPGANDDASGSATLLEAARTIVMSGMQFNKPIYFIWYAAEEKGEWGSIAVANYFTQHHISVDAVLQLDQTGFAYQNSQTIYLETGKSVNAKLTKYLQLLSRTYVKQPTELNCSGSSDEEIWTNAHVVAARPLESDYCDFDHMYHAMHSNQDTIDKLSLSHMTAYLKLSIAFIVELAEPKI